MPQIALLPAGCMTDYAGTSAPSGWLFCNGATVSRTTYNVLFAAISTAYGVGDGTTTFALPDFRGRFARYNDSMGGSMGAASRDTGRVHGSTQTQATAKNGLGLTDPAHSHPRAYSVKAGISQIPADQSAAFGYGGGRAADQAMTTGISLSAGDSETRPINLSCNKIIKV